MIGLRFLAEVGIYIEVMFTFPRKEVDKCVDRLDLIIRVGAQWARDQLSNLTSSCLVANIGLALEIDVVD